MGAGASAIYQTRKEYLALSEADKREYEQKFSILVSNGLNEELAFDTLAPKPSKELHIVHFNDVYNLNVAYKEDPRGGARKFATALKQYKQQLAGQCLSRPLVLFSGDFIGPSLMSSVTKGAHLIDTLNALGCDYATFGNHELDYGYESLKGRLDGVDHDVYDESIGWHDYETSETQWIMTNMTEAATGFPMGGARVNKFALFDWGGGYGDKAAMKPMKVGLLAVSENWLNGCSQLPPNTIVYEDYIESARKTAIHLRNLGADIVLAITHNRLANDYALTEAVPEIDLLLGGHDHFYKSDLSKRIVKSGEEWRWLSKIKIELPQVPAGTRAKPIVSLETVDITSNLHDDIIIDSICDKYDAFAQKKFGMVLFQSAISFDPTEEYVRFKEAPIANWICDCCADDYSLQEGIQTVDLTIIQGFHFCGKAAMPAGNFTLGDLFSIFPKSTTMVVVYLTGQEILQTLTLGCSSLPAECGSLCHVSGNASYTVNLPTVAGQKPTVSNVTIGGQPIDLTKRYEVSVTNSQAKGKFGQTWMQTAERIVEEEFAPQIIDLVQMYCNRHKNDPTKNPANPTVGRITIV